MTLFYDTNKSQSGAVIYCFLAVIIFLLASPVVLGQQPNIPTFSSVVEIPNGQYESIAHPTNAGGMMIIKINSPAIIQGHLFKGGTIIEANADGKLQEVFTFELHEIQGTKYPPNTVFWFSPQGRLREAYTPNGKLVIYDDTGKEAYPGVPLVPISANKIKWPCPDIRPWGGQRRSEQEIMEGFNPAPQQTITTLTPLAIGDYLVLSRHSNGNIQLVKLFKSYTVGKLNFPAGTVLSFGANGSLSFAHLDRIATLESFELPAETTLIFYPSGPVNGIIGREEITIGSFRAAAYKVIYLYPNGAIDSIELTSQAVVQNNVLPPRSRVIFDHHGALEMIKYSNDYVAMGIPVKGNEFACFLEDGTLGNITLAAPYTINGITFPSDTTIIIDEQKSLRRAVLKQEIEIQGLKLMGNSWAAFHANGVLKGAWLAKDASIKGIPVRAGKLTGFYPDGSLMEGILAVNTDIKGFPCKGGETVKLNEQGKPIYATFYAPFQIGATHYAAGQTYTGWATYRDVIKILEPSDVRALLDDLKGQIQKELESQILANREHFPFATMDRIDNSTSRYELYAQEVKFRFEWRVEDMLENVPLASDCDCDCGVSISLKWRLNDRRDQLVVYIESIPITSLRVYCPGCPFHNLAIAYSQFFNLFNSIPGRQILNKNISPAVNKKVKSVIDLIESDPAVMSAEIERFYIENNAFYVSYTYSKYGQ